MYRVSIRHKSLVLDEVQGVHLSETLQQAYALLWSDYKHNCTLEIFRDKVHTSTQLYRYENEKAKRIEKPKSKRRKGNIQGLVR